MRILFLCHRFPYPADGGGKIRALEMIRHLGRSHEVHVVSMLRGEDDAARADGLLQWCAQVDAPRVSEPVQSLRMGASALTGRSLSAGYFHAPAVERVVRDRLGRHRYDRIVVHCSSMAPYVAHARGVRKLLDLCDIDSEKWRMFADATRGPRSLLYRFEQHAVARLERQMTDCFDICTVATPGELELLRGLGGSAHADWFPNGVDAHYFAPPSNPPDADLLGFVGRMDYLPNEQAVIGFCHHTLPRIRAERPGTRFVVIGANPPESVRRLAEMDGVIVTGTVPDVRPWLGRLRAMVAPLSIARGVQNKLLESMAMGVPVVTSALAARGVDAVPGEDLLCADSPEEVARAALAVLADDGRHGALRRRGLALVAERYSWSAALARLDGMLSLEDSGRDPLRDAPRARCGA